MSAPFPPTPRCPTCEAPCLARIGPRRYLCSDCAVEIERAANGTVQAWRITVDGDLVPFKHPASGRVG